MFGFVGFVITAHPGFGCFASCFSFPVGFGALWVFPVVLGVLFAVV